MVSASDVTAIKGNAIAGSLRAFNGVDPNADEIDIDTDWDTAGYPEFALASSAEGISVAKSADSNVIVAWGDQEIDELFSNNSVNVTINIFSFKSLATLKVLFGKNNVTQTGNVIKVRGRGVSAAEKNSIAIVGVDKNGLAAVLYLEIAAVDPNFEFTWNDTDPVAIPAVFKLYKNAAGDFFQLFLETAAPVTP